MPNKKIIDFLEKLKAKGEVLPATSDTIFKNLFQDEEMKGIIAYIISEITLLPQNELFEKMTFKNTEHAKDKVLEKGKTSDVVVEVNDNIIILEMNNVYDKGTRLKNDAYHRKVASEKYKAGMPYKEDLMAIINFNNEQTFDDRKIIKYVMMDEERHTIYDEKFVNYHINLAKFNKMYYNKEKLNRFEKIMVLLGLKKKEELWKLAKGDKELEKMVKKIEDMTENVDLLPQSYIELMEEVARVVNLDEARKEGIEQGVKQGIEQGQKENSLEIAKSMLGDNMDINIIAKHTGLSEEEIESLK